MIRRRRLNEMWSLSADFCSMKRQLQWYAQLTSGDSTVAIVGLKVAALTNRLKMILVAPESAFSKSSVIWHT